MRPIFGLIFVLFNKNRYKNVSENDILQKKNGGKVMEDVKRQLCIKAFSVAEAVKSDRFFLKATDCVTGRVNRKCNIRYYST